MLLFLLILFFSKVIFKEQSISKKPTHISISSNYSSTVFLNSPYFQHGSMKIMDNKKKVAEFQNYRSFLIRNTTKNTLVSFDHIDEKLEKMNYWSIPNTLCRTKSIYFLSADYKVTANMEPNESSCFFSDPKGSSHYTQVTVKSGGHVNIEFYINNSIVADYFCKSAYENQTVTCRSPYSQPFFFRVTTTSSPYLVHIEYSVAFKGHEVRDCFIEQVPIVGKGDQVLPTYKIKIDGKVCTKISGFKVAVFIRISLFFTVILTVCASLQITGYLDFCGWWKAPGEMATSLTENESRRRALPSNLSPYYQSGSSFEPVSDT